MEVDAIANVADDVPDRKQKVRLETVSKLASLSIKADSTVEHLTPQAQVLARMAAEAKQHRCAGVCVVRICCLAEHVHTLPEHDRGLYEYENAKSILQYAITHDVIAYRPHRKTPMFQLQRRRLGHQAACNAGGCCPNTPAV